MSAKISQINYIKIYSYYFGISKMSGGLMALVAYGAQDIYLTANPETTFFSQTYNRHEDDVTKKTKVMKYYKYEEYVKECPICYSDFECHDMVEVTACGHCFHHHCLQQWLETSSHHNCPMCREKVSKSYDDKKEKETDMRWVDDVGHSLISDVSVEVGGQTVDRQSGEWLDMWNEVSSDR